MPNNDGQPECIYFTTEFYDGDVKDNRIGVNTIPLGGLEELRRIGEYAWINTPLDVTGGINNGWTADNIWGKIFTKGLDTYTLRNQSNEPVRITAYVCRCRMNTIRYNGTINENVYNYMGEGFAENGHDVGNQAATNTGLTVDTMNIRQSRLFCRTFKIVKQYQLKIGPGQTAVRKMNYKWRKHVLADYMLTDNANTNWTTKTRRYAHLKGEMFTLFKLHGNIGGIPAQATLMKVIGQTTPTVILQTQRNYWFKHFPRPAGAMLLFASVGTNNQAPSIMRDDDEKAGTEQDAS